jgi:hypothetical protein
MRPSDRTITRLPLTELWDAAGVVPGVRGPYVGAEEIRALLRAGGARFAIADGGEPLRWVEGPEAFDLWKREVQPRLVPPETADAGDGRRRLLSRGVPRRVRIRRDGVEGGHRRAHHPAGAPPLNRPRANESLQLTERRIAPHRQHGSNPAAPQLNSGVRRHSHDLGRAQMAHLTDSGDAQTWDLAGYRVTQLVIDTASVRVEAWTLAAALEVRFGAPFRVLRPGGEGVDLDPARSRELAPLLEFVGVELASLTVTRAGALSLALVDGTRLQVASHPVYEAFEARGSGALEHVGYLASPGGGSPWGL